MTRTVRRWLMAAVAAAVVAPALTLPGPVSASTAAAPLAAPAARSADCLTAGLGGKGWKAASSPDVRIWARASRPRDVRRAKSLATTVQGTIYSRFATLLQREVPSDGTVRCPHGKDGRLDVYISPNGRYAGGTERLPTDVAAAYRPYSGEPCDPLRPGFIVVRASVNGWLLAHEVYHAFQAAFPRKDDCTDYSWWDEATATWAGDDAFPKAQVEHDHTDALVTPRRFITAPFGYRAWIYPYALAKVHGRPVMRQIELAAGQLSSGRHIDAATPGGIAGFWPLFSLLTWNQTPLADASGGGVDLLGRGALSFRKWDGLTPRPEITPTPLSLGGAGARTLQQPLNPPGSSASYVNALGRHFRHWRITDPRVREITLTPGLTGGRPVVGALIRTGDGKWRSENWTGRRQIRFCRDTPGQNVTEMVVAFGNAALDISEQTNGVPKIELNATCGFPAQLSGTFSGSVTTSRFTLSWTGSVTKTYLPNDPITGRPYGFEMRYRTTAATVTWSVSGECTGGGTLHTADLSDGFPDSDIDLDETPTKGYGYSLYLAPNSGVDMPYSCPGPTTGNAAYLVGMGGEGALIYNSDSRGAESNRYSTDLKRFAGSLRINPGLAQAWDWNLTGTGSVQPPN